MKTITARLLIPTAFIFLYSCSTSYTPYAYDDVYYSPKNDPVNQVKIDPRPELNKTNQIQYDGTYENRYDGESNQSPYPQEYYQQNRYSQEESKENNQSAYTYQESNSSTYYDTNYAQTVININSPIRNFNTYDPYQRDRIIYTQDPYFYNNNVYGRFSYWDPFMPFLGFGWNSYSGWNFGIGFNYGISYRSGYGRWGYHPMYYNPYDPWFSFNPYFGYNCGYYGWNNYYYPYNNGYNNNYYRGIDYQVSNRRTIKTPRGNSGSRTYQNTSTRPERNPVNVKPSSAEKNGGSIRPERNVNPSRKEIPSNNSTLVRPPVDNRSNRTVTPEKYKPTRKPVDYSRPSSPVKVQPMENNVPQNNRPVRKPDVRPTTPPVIQKYSQPRNNNSYNRSPQLRQEPAQRPAQPSQRESRPSENYNKPSFNNTRPAYTAPRINSSPRQSVPSRPNRR